MMCSGTLCCAMLWGSHAAHVVWIHYAKLCCAVSRYALAPAPNGASHVVMMAVQDHVDLRHKGQRRSGSKASAGGSDRRFKEERAL